MAIEPKTQRVNEQIRTSPVRVIAADGSQLGIIPTADALAAARQATLNALAVIKAAVGSLDCVEEVVQVRGFVNSAPGFFLQPQVMNGASELLVAVFGGRGRHARCALGTSSLPHNIPVEIEMIVAVRSA